MEIFYPNNKEKKFNSHCPRTKGKGLTGILRIPELGKCHHQKLSELAFSDSGTFWFWHLAISLKILTLFYSDTIQSLSQAYFMLPHLLKLRLFFLGSTCRMNPSSSLPWLYPTGNWEQYRELLFTSWICCRAPVPEMLQSGLFRSGGTGSQHCQHQIQTQTLPGKCNGQWKNKGDEIKTNMNASHDNLWIEPCRFGKWTKSHFLVPFLFFAISILWHAQDAFSRPVIQGSYRLTSMFSFYALFLIFWRPTTIVIA